MPPAAVVHLARSLKAVNILPNYGGKCGAAMVDAADQRPGSESNGSMEELEAQIRVYRDLCLALQDVVARLNQLHDEIIAGHHEAIARLSVEIARKVLMRNISDGDYEMELIIKEALKNAPQGAGVVVRLNPQDLADFRKLHDADQPALLGVELTADASIGRAECVVESSKGIIKLLIDEHLEQISKALVKTG